MKTLALLLPLPLCLAACVSVELPNVVSDTAKAGKEAYRAATGKGEAKPTPKANEAALISNTYIGKATQTVAEIQQACVAEAAEKLAQTRGSGATPGAYTVIDNQLSIVNNAVVATCRLGASTGTGPPA
jgi:hypothetical protein